MTPVVAVENEVSMPPAQLPLRLALCRLPVFGTAARTHLGLPSPSLTLAIGLGPQTMLAAMPDPRQRPPAFDVLVGGLHSRPAVPCGRSLAASALARRQPG